jgi:hypothetical protein
MLSVFSNLIYEQGVRANEFSMEISSIEMSIKGNDRRVFWRRIS